MGSTFLVIKFLFLTLENNERYNEALRLHERHLVFNVAELKRRVAECLDLPDHGLLRIRKLAEGSFNRVFVLTIPDGGSVLARLPYPATCPKLYATASEVATMDLARSYGLPVPRVLAYSVTDTNSVGSEYIIMEKMPGRSLGEIWYEVSEEQRLKLIVNVVKMEALMFSRSLPGSGSIYYKQDLIAEIDTIDIPTEETQKGFCIGPDAHYQWWHKERSHSPIGRRPCTFQHR